jgi:hypothetical protein
MNPRRGKRPELVPVTVYLPVPVANRYRAQARAEDRTLSAECRRALERALTETA